MKITPVAVITLFSCILSIVLSIPGKTEVFHIVDSPESDWTWTGRISDRYYFNAVQQKFLYEHLIMNYIRSIPKPPSLISEENPLTILIWNTTGFEKLLEDPSWSTKCSVPCQVTTDRSLTENAHIVMSTGQETPEVFAFLQPHQVKALFVLEPDLSFPDASHRMEPYQMLVSYSKHSDVRVDYSRSMTIPMGIPNFASKKKKALAAAFISNCEANGDARYRLDYFRELKVHMDIDSYGDCLHTPGLPTNVDFAKIASDYHFVLVFENSILDDYITDKFYKSLGTDAIPVYLGAPNIAEYLPERHSNKIVVEARNYPDPTGLAKYLRTLAADETEYLRFFEWRDSVIDRSFSKKLDFESLGSDSFICRMCEYYDIHAEK